MSKRQSKPERDTIQPLGPLGMLLLPLLLLTSKGTRRAKLEKRANARRDAKARREYERLKRKRGLHEAKIYKQILISTWTRLGSYYAFRWKNAPPEERAPKEGRRRKVQKVNIERTFINDFFVYFKIQTRKRGLFGTRDVMPHRVLLQDLLSDTTLYEQSRALERVASRVDEDPRFGAWIRVHRLEGIGGLPTHVSFREMLKHVPLDTSKGIIALGMAEHGKVYFGSFEAQPHWLIGGTTGSGKSNLVNLIISTLLWLYPPDELNLILVDMKRMELIYFEDAAHLKNPVISDPDTAFLALEHLYHEIQQRTILMSRRAKNLSAWNKKYTDEKLPRIVMVIDEFAELMYSGKKFAAELEALVSQISALGRAVGIHLIICTQRPATDVVTGRIKLNMGLAIAGQVQTASQSVTILGTGAAAELPDVPGRMACLSGAKIQHIQTGYISDDDVAQAVRISRGRGAGLIDLDGIDPVIRPERLLAHIVDNLNGTLSLSKLAPELRELGISQDMLKPFLADVILRGLKSDLYIQSVAYVLNRERNSYRLTRKYVPEMYLLPATVPTSAHEDAEAYKQEALRRWREARAAREVTQSA